MINEVVIFCESYPQIKNTLYLAGQNYQNHPVTIVIPGMTDLYKFINLVNEKAFQSKLKVVYFDAYRGRIGKPGSRIIKAFFLFPEIIQERRYLRSVFKKRLALIQGADVFFFGMDFNPVIYYLLNAFGKTNRLVFMPDPMYDSVSIPEANPSNLIEMVHLLRYKLIYGRDMVLGKHPLRQKVPRMPDSFFETRVDRVISGGERESMIKGFDVSRIMLLDDSDYGIMFFHEELVEQDYISDASTFERILADVFNVIRKHLPEDKVAIKYHPGYPESKTAVPFGIRLPDFIPAEFLYNDKIKMYLGISSRALSNVEKGLAVSLINIVNFKSETVKERLKEMLIKSSHSEILFPESLDEFERILSGLKP